jgi:DNA-binding beta-propeller fold protein YncE
MGLVPIILIFSGAAFNLQFAIADDFDDTGRFCNTFQCTIRHLLYNPRDGQVYAAIYNPASIGAWGDPTRVTLPSSPSSLEYSRYYTDIFATLPDQDSLAIINYDTMTLRTTVPVGDSPYDIVYVEGADRLYVSNF